MIWMDLNRIPCPVEELPTSEALDIPPLLQMEFQQILGHFST